MKCRELRNSGTHAVLVFVVTKELIRLDLRFFEMMFFFCLPACLPDNEINKNYCTFCHKQIMEIPNRYIIQTCSIFNTLWQAKSSFQKTSIKFYCVKYCTICTLILLECERVHIKNSLRSVSSRQILRIRFKHQTSQK